MVEQTAPGPLLASAELVLRGERLLDEPDRASVASAEAVFKSALEADPGDGAAFAGLARAIAIRYSRRWEEDDALPDRALDLARKSVVASPDDPRAHGALALAALVAEDADLAFDEADRAWALRSATTPAWVAEAWAQTMSVRGDHKAAIQALEEIRASQPARYQTWQLLGIARLELGELNEAERCFRRSRLLAPRFPLSLIQLARVYDRMGRRDYAVQIFTDVTRDFPEERGRILVRMSASLIGRGKYAEAMSGLDQAKFRTKRGLGEGTVVYMKALCLEKLGRVEEAVPLYNRVIQEFPAASYGSISGDNLAASSYEAVARIEMKRGRQDEAVRLMEEAMTKQKPTLSLYTSLATTYGDYGLHAEAVKVLKRAAATDFGPRKAGLKSSVYVAWARQARAADRDATGPVPELLEALERDATAIRARGQIGDFLEAARACVLAGDSARAIGWLRAAVDDGYRKLDWIESDKDLAPLVRERGFEELSRKLPRP